MTHPKASPGKNVLLSAILARDVPDQVPRWMDRRFGYTPKRPKNGNTKKTKRRK